MWNAADIIFKVYAHKLILALVEAVIAYLIHCLYNTIIVLFLRIVTISIFASMKCKVMSIEGAKFLVFVL